MIMTNIQQTKDKEISQNIIVIYVVMTNTVFLIVIMFIETFSKCFQCHSHLTITVSWTTQFVYYQRGC